VEGGCAAACALLEREALPLAGLAPGRSRARVVGDEAAVAACLRDRGLAWAGELAAKRRPRLGAVGTVRRVERAAGREAVQLAFADGARMWWNPEFVRLEGSAAIKADAGRAVVGEAPAVEWGTLVEERGVAWGAAELVAWSTLLEWSAIGPEHAGAEAQRARLAAMVDPLEGGPGAVGTAGLRARLRAIVAALDADGDGKVRRVEVRKRPTPAFYSCIPKGMHGPACIVWANLTPFSAEVGVAVATERGVAALAEADDILLLAMLARGGQGDSRALTLPGGRELLLVGKQEVVDGVARPAGRPLALARARAAAAAQDVDDSHGAVPSRRRFAPPRVHFIQCHELY
jgi:hypothetical protein